MLLFYNESNYKWEECNCKDSCIFWWVVGVFDSLVTKMFGDVIFIYNKILI